VLESGDGDLEAFTEFFNSHATDNKIVYGYVKVVREGGRQAGRAVKGHGV